MKEQNVAESRQRVQAYLLYALALFHLIDIQADDLSSLPDGILIVPCLVFPQDYFLSR